MSFQAKEIAFLQRLASDRPADRAAGVVARMFSEQYSLGVRVGSRIEYAEHHYAAAEGLLRAHDLPLTALAADASRADAAAYGGMSEKDFSAAPHANSVAVKALGACTLQGQSLYTPLGAYLVLTVEQTLDVRCDRLMLVENLETFRTLDAHGWLDRQGHDVLAVYRGEVDLPTRDAALVVKATQLPLWSFCDFDPAGLAMANALPPDKLERLVLPPLDWLRAQADTARGRQLFDSQVAGYEAVLDAATHPGVISAWQLMRSLRSAVTQERMRALAA